MRKSREEAAETRKRIVAAASGEFRAKGIVASGLADLMKAAGLTHGGFYKHFASKDQLIAEATVEAAEGVVSLLTSQPTAGAAVATYLSARHRDNPAVGCPFAAMGGELSRSDPETREVATEGFRKFVAVLAGRDGTEEARRRALVAASTMIGAMMMSRMVADPTLSAEILSEAEKSLAEAGSRGMETPPGLR